jgi:hypothetical protein
VFDVAIVIKPLNNFSVFDCAELTIQCAEISREIWYLPDREEIQTAISRLWGAISAFKNGDEYGGIMEITMTVELLLPDISNHLLLDRYLEAAMNIHEIYKMQNLWDEIYLMIASWVSTA